MYTGFGREIAKQRVAESHGKAATVRREKRPEGPSRLRIVMSKGLIALGGRLGRVEVAVVGPLLMLNITKAW
jgi:hypothetical protein